MLPCNFTGEITLTQHQQNSVKEITFTDLEASLSNCDLERQQFFFAKQTNEKNIISVFKNATVLLSQFSKKNVYFIFFDLKLYTLDIKMILKQLPSLDF